ncbi:MAG: UDP-2,3-diacylglucosamine diphosphatase [Planctomycetota bacterium]|nr:UDP-2,3-diacylglucosamine diphosphatase [Planctomycetota bacterium]
MSGVRLPAGSVPVDEVTVPAGAVVVTDLHLSPEGDARTDAFLAWWDARAPRPPMLIVLGDLFDTWVGPKQGRLPGSATVLAFFEGLAGQGVAVHLVPGNRDALMGADVEDATGASVHLEGFVGALADGSRAAFVHGDGLCILDRGYQRLRKVWRMGAVRAVSRLVPLFVARAVARRLRRRSERAKPLKLDAERAIRPEAVDALARATDADLVVCGHAHEPRDERAPGGARWVVVGAFGEGRGGEVLELQVDRPTVRAQG